MLNGKLISIIKNLNLMKAALKIAIVIFQEINSMNSNSTEKKPITQYSTAQLGKKRVKYQTFTYPF